MMKAGEVREKLKGLGDRAPVVMASGNEWMTPSIRWLNADEAAFEEGLLREAKNGRRAVLVAVVE